MTATTRAIGAGVFTGLVLLSHAAVAQTEATSGAGGACTRTAKAADEACGNQTKADYSLAIGTCQNIRDGGKKSECLQRAKAQVGKSTTLCARQLDARLELCKLIGEKPYDPQIKPADFDGEIDNKYYPLKPGTTYIYRGKTGDGVEEVEFSVLKETETILGVKCTVVRDRVTVDGQVVEDTIDWFAQDRRGNVWYFGEISQSFENGDLVSLAGSWRAGVDGAKPGIVMKANPQVGDVYRQEFSLGVAEDYAKVLSRNGKARTPAASCNDCVVTRDLVPLEPDANERKFYAPGIGFILEIDEKTGDRVELVEIKRR